MSNNLMDPILNEIFNKAELSKSELYDFYDKTIYDINIKCDNSYFNKLKINVDDIKEEVCKLWGNVYKILDNWNNCNKFSKIHPKKCCNYFNYWLYGKFKNDAIYSNIDNIKIIYKAWDNFFNDCHDKKICNIRNKYINFNKEQLEKKKNLFDFLELYYLLKDKLIVDVKTDECCKYINKMFKLYKEMENTSNKKIYEDEILLFRSKFHGNYSELNFLNNKCPKMCLHLVFNSYNKTLCPFENEKSGVHNREQIQKCISKQNDILPIDGDTMNEENSFENFHPLGIYGEMNEKIEEKNYYDICSGFLSNNNEHCEDYILCIMIARNLIKLSKLKDDKRIQNCHYFIHWLYDKIGKIYGKSKNAIQDETTVNKIFNVSYMILQKLGINDCYYEVLDLDLVQNKERKYLHDYFENYKNIESKTCDNNNNCQQYCERIMKINELYKKYIEKCCTYYSKDDYSDDCKYYFKCNQNYNPYNLYKKLKCYEVIPSDNEKMEEVKITLVKDYVQQLINDYRNKLKLMINGNTSGSLCEGFICDTFYMPVLLLFGLLGILLISFIVYKIKSSGLTSNKKTLRKNKIMHSIEEYDNQFSNINPRRERVRIAYNKT
ncbi:PIR protein [Plasmodium vivax]|uniref:VIR protein n=1 Tax=Plasmodium vivax TaxID=5855 RepID=A0A564ZP08_PLAVI|nr:PIR protein [Plasmodium vivax]VUZ93452.1 PIR protein [Plasmodium vivax]